MSAELLQIVARNLDKLLQERGISRPELSDLSGVARSTIHRAITGKNELTLSNAVSIARALGVTVEQLTREGNSKNVGTVAQGRRADQGRRKSLDHDRSDRRK